MEKAVPFRLPIIFVSLSLEYNTENHLIVNEEVAIGAYAGDIPRGFMHEGTFYSLLTSCLRSGTGKFLSRVQLAKTASPIPSFFERRYVG